MRLFLMVLLAIGSGTFASSAVFAQQAPHLSRSSLSRSTVSAQARPVQPNRSDLAAPGDRAIQRDSSSLVAATTVRPCPADICREVRPAPSYDFYPDSTLRSPLFLEQTPRKGAYSAVLTPSSIGIISCGAFFQLMRQMQVLSLEFMYRPTSS